MMCVHGVYDAYLVCGTYMVHMCSMCFVCVSVCDMWYMCVGHVYFVYFMCYMQCMCNMYMFGGCISMFLFSCP
jgi:hypothetical protein